MTKCIGIIGLGWLGTPLAHHLMAQGYAVKGTVTSAEKLQPWKSSAVKANVLKVLPEGIEGDLATFLRELDVLIVNYPPRRVPEIETTYPAQAQQLINACSRELRVIFVSTTGVYGNTNGTVTEGSEVPPERASGKAVLAAERLLSKHFGQHLTILRFAGLIGPDRHPGKFLSGKRQLKNGGVPVNLIHQQDCIGLIESVIQQDCFGEIINGCADEHPLRRDYYRKASEELGLPEPEFEADEEAPYKLVNNTKSKKLLGYEYRFPSPNMIFQRPD